LIRQTKRIKTGQVLLEIERAASQSIPIRSPAARASSRLKP